MDADDVQRLVDQADDAALLRAVDGLAATRDWDLLETLGERCRQAVEIGRQLWGVAMHVDYRLAWEAPASHAARAVERGSSRFTLGPLTEVAASTHDWDALGAHLENPVARATIAQERALRGEDLRGEAALQRLAAVPLRREPWEPVYALPTYRDREAAFPQPGIAAAAVPLDRDDTVVAEPFADAGAQGLRDVTRAWWTQSTGTAAAVAVEGDAAAAVCALRAGRAGPWGLRRIAPDEALALLQWAGASGGANAPRPGGAAGRFSAWWAAAAVAGLDWPEPLDADFAVDLADALTELRWYRWAGAEPDTGWTLRLAVEDPQDGLAWAVEALDRREDDDGEDEGGGPA